MFYLLLYGIVENEKLSQRTLEDTFNDFLFKTLFDIDKSETIRRSSISKRLSKIDSDYFVQIYQCVYLEFHDAYPNTGKKKGNIHYKEELVDTSLRLIVAKTKTEDPKEFWFITYDFDLSAKENSASL